MKLSTLSILSTLSTLWDYVRRAMSGTTPKPSALTRFTQEWPTC